MEAKLDNQLSLFEQIEDLQAENTRLSLENQRLKRDLTGLEAQRDDLLGRCRQLTQDIDMLKQSEFPLKQHDVCPICGKQLNQGWQGRDKIYCSKACKQRAYRQRQKALRNVTELPAT